MKIQPDNPSSIDLGKLDKLLDATRVEVTTLAHTHELTEWTTAAPGFAFCHCRRCGLAFAAEAWLYPNGRSKTFPHSAQHRSECIRVSHGELRRRLAARPESYVEAIDRVAGEWQISREEAMRKILRQYSRRPA